MAAQNNIICVDRAFSLPAVADTTECMFSSSACKRPDPYVEIRLGSVGCESHHLDNTVSPDFAAEHGGKVCEATGYAMGMLTSTCHSHCCDFGSRTGARATARRTRRRA